jgi:hypothetical protein
MLCQKKIKIACGVNDTAFKVGAVSLTPHACVHAVLMTPYAQCMQ